jgi:hypothetical protein
MAEFLPAEVQTFTRRVVQPCEVEGMGRDMTFVRGVFDHANKLEGVDEPALAERVTYFPLPMKHSWVVVEVLSTGWLEGDRVAVSDMVRKRLAQVRRTEGQSKWFDPAAIRARAERPSAAR